MVDLISSCGKALVTSPGVIPPGPLSWLILLPLLVPLPPFLPLPLIPLPIPM